MVQVDFILVLKVERIPQRFRRSGSTGAPVMVQKSSALIDFFHGLKKIELEFREAESPADVTLTKKKERFF